MTTLILYAIALCNIYGNAHVPVSKELNYTITVNDIVVNKNEKLPEYLFQDMTDLSEFDLDYLTEIDPEMLIADNITINIHCSKS